MPGPSTEKQNSRVFYFDYLRVWATIGVVVLHAAVLVFVTERKGEVDFASQFNVGNAYDSLGRFGVSCFFMISGALLLAPHHRFRLRKQTLRVFVPLVVWSAVYAVANVYFTRHDLPVINGSNPDDGSFLEALKSFFTGPLAYHLWFVYVLVGIYLVVPLLRPLTALPDAVRTRLLEYALGLWLVFTLLIPAARNVWPSLLKPYALVFPDLPTGYLGIVLLGFYLHHREVRVHRLVLIAGAAAGVGATFLLVYFEQTRRDGSLWAYNNLTPHVVLFAACIFLLAKTTFDRPGRYFAFIALFSRLSYRIYLVHVLILHYLRAISPLKDWYLDAPLIAIPALAAITLAASFALAWLIDQVKPIRAYI